MKKVIIISVALFGSILLYSQETTEMIQSKKMFIKERKAFVVKNAEKRNAKCMKEAKKQAKALVKDGWKPAVGAVSIEEQLCHLLLRENEMNRNYPKYIIGRSQAVSDNYTNARKMAESRAYADIASNISVEIICLAEDARINKQISATEVETITKFMSSTQQRVRQNIGKTDILLEIYRESEGKTEFMIGACYDGELSKELIRHSLPDGDGELKTNLEKLLQ